MSEILTYDEALYLHQTPSYDRRFASLYHALLAETAQHIASAQGVPLGGLAAAGLARSTGESLGRKA